MRGVRLEPGVSKARPVLETKGDMRQKLASGLRLRFLRPWNKGLEAILQGTGLQSHCFQ